mmetsp:Transcript_4352/g.9404  ORF Transcript_4352/g.9404 Transcript_4352/m.9404 type:complete len:104 (+) Transcript_4352:154-465(+)
MRLNLYAGEVKICSGSSIVFHFLMKKAAKAAKRTKQMPPTVPAIAGTVISPLSVTVGARVGHGVVLSPVAEVGALVGNDVVPFRATQSLSKKVKELVGAPSRT